MRSNRVIEAGLTGKLSQLQPQVFESLEEAQSIIARLPWVSNTYFDVTAPVAPKLQS